MPASPRSEDEDVDFTEEKPEAQKLSNPSFPIFARNKEFY